MVEKEMQVKVERVRGPSPSWSSVEERLVLIGGRGQFRIRWRRKSESNLVEQKFIVNMATGEIHTSNSLSQSSSLLRSGYRPILGGETKICISR
jgi:hypothetical protein